MDHLDCTTNHHQLSNDSSATLISSNKMTNSIRMAYPNSNTINSNVNHGMLPHHISDIYANHSLLTTTSTTTGSYIANGGAHNNGIETTPRLQINQQQQSGKPLTHYLILSHTKPPRGKNGSKWSEFYTEIFTKIDYVS